MLCTYSPLSHFCIKSVPFPSENKIVLTACDPRGTRALQTKLPASVDIFVTRNNNYGIRTEMAILFVLSDSDSFFAAVLA